MNLAAVRNLAAIILSVALLSGCFGLQIAEPQTVTGMVILVEDALDGKAIAVSILSDEGMLVVYVFYNPSNFELGKQKRYRLSYIGLTIVGEVTAYTLTNVEKL